MNLHNGKTVRTAAELKSVKEAYRHMMNLVPGQAMERVLCYMLRSKISIAGQVYLDNHLYLEKVSVNNIFDHASKMISLNKGDHQSKNGRVDKTHKDRKAKKFKRKRCAFCKNFGHVK